MKSKSVLILTACLMISYCGYGADSRTRFRFRAANASEPPAVYSVPVAQNATWKTNLKLVAEPPDSFSTRISDGVGFPGDSVSLAAGEMHYMKNFGDFVSNKGAGGYGFFKFTNPPCEKRCGKYGEAATRVELYFSNGVTTSAFHVPAVKPFAVAGNQTGNAYGVESNENRGTWIVLWGVTQRFLVKVYDEKNQAFNASFLVTPVDYIDGKLTHYRVPFTFEGIGRVSVTLVCENECTPAPAWGVVVSGPETGTSQDVIPLYRE